MLDKNKDIVIKVRRPGLLQKSQKELLLLRSLTSDKGILSIIDKLEDALNHEYMSSQQEDDQPKNGGKQITINSDRITFNTSKASL